MGLRFNRPRATLHSADRPVVSEAAGVNPSQHPAAPEHLPPFLPGADGADPLMIVTGLILISAVIGFGLVFLRLHTMPERMAHRGHKLQFEIVAVLGLLALFTHIHLFWVAGLLLALIDIPDLIQPLQRIAGSSERIAGSTERIAGQPADDDHALPAQGASERAHGQERPAPGKPPKAASATPAAEPALEREH
jgi:hypothetical protein